MKRFRLSGAALAVVAMVAAMVVSAAYGITTAGISGQPDWKSCVSNTNSDLCTDVAGLPGPTGMALADDESRVFVAAGNGVAVFVRDRSTGKLEQLQQNKGGCTNEDASDSCFDGYGLNGAADVASVGANAYIAATGSNAVVTLTKDNQGGKWSELPTTGLNNQFCLSTPASDGCAAANGLAGATAITAFGSYVYVGGPGRIAAFHRGTKGALKQLAGNAGCIGTGTGCTGGLGFGTVQNMTVSRDGKTLYAVDGSDVLVFQRTKTTGALTQLPSPAMSNVTGPNGVSVDQQGTPTSVYVTGSNNVVGVFARNKSNGTLTQLPGNGGQDGCVSAGGGACTAGPRLGNIGNLVGLVVYKTNRFVYVAGANGVAAFSRIKSGDHGGAVAPLPDPAGCVTATGDGGQCIDANGLLSGGGIGGLTDIFSTGGGKHIYVSGSVGGGSVVTLHQGG